MIPVSVHEPLIGDPRQQMQSLVRSGSTQSTYDSGHIGDINADGFADVIFKDLYNLQVFFGSATGLPAVIDISLSLNGYNGMLIVSDEDEDESDEASIRLVSGNRSLIVDDITGDGVDDLLVVSISHAAGSLTKVKILAGYMGLWKA
jgi:orotate phosphoribosyltransferase